MDDCRVLPDILYEGPEPRVYCSCVSCANCRYILGRCSSHDVLAFKVYDVRMYICRNLPVVQTLRGVSHVSLSQ